MSPVKTKGTTERKKSLPKAMSKDELRKFVLDVIKEDLNIEIECKSLGEIQVRLILDGEYLSHGYDFLTQSKLEVI